MPRNLRFLTEAQFQKWKLYKKSLVFEVKQKFCYYMAHLNDFFEQDGIVREENNETSLMN